MSLELVLPAVAIASSAFMIYSTYRLSKSLKSPQEPKVVESREGYIAKLKELEYRRDMIRNAILNVIKEFDSGKISEELKNQLLNRFREELNKIENEINSISKYAELEKLEREYNKLLNEYEERRRRLEKRISELRSMLKIREEAKEVKKPIKERKPREEYTLEDLMKEISKMMKDLEEE